MKKQLNKKMVSILVVALSLISLSLAAFAPMNIDPAQLDRYGGPGTGDDNCDADCEGTGTGTGIGNSGVGRNANPQGQGAGYAGSMMGSGIGLGELSAVEAEDLVLAIVEEYRARALYEYVIETFGPEVPFVEIAASEAKHTSVLVRQADKYGIDYPAYDPSVFDFPTFATIEEALQAGVDAEIADAALYDTLMAGTNRADLLRVYTNLQNASLNNHLVSFEFYLND
ncbi:MAG: DUF2202 domain-containing protein [Anaerolineae bacterium]|nr:DUF2202 domain-containing protein [Anaerolineae bacterium]